MVIVKRYIKFILTISTLMLCGCVEEFIPETITFEDFLVVEATITNEFKFQEIKLSRTFKFEEELSYESNADVRIIDDNQNIYVFNQTTPGVYVSTIKFSAEPDKSYTLQINTKDNRSYLSSPVNLPANTAHITDVSYSQVTNSDGDLGINILVDSFDPSGNSIYYRYEYEETSQLLPPYWSPFDPIIVSEVPLFKVHWKLREREERICYNTNKNINIIQTTTRELNEDRVTGFPVKFISKTDPIIRDRYSILVKQLVQSFEAYNYYNTLNEFSNSESVFTENQPGFIEGNIFSTNNNNDKVLGFFELASISSKRIFFNFRDAFPNDARPSYFVSCEEPLVPILNPTLDINQTNSSTRSPLLDLLATGEYDIFSLRFPSFPTPEFLDSLVLTSPYEIVKKECSDCTIFGSNIRPDFWID